MNLLCCTNSIIQKKYIHSGNMTNLTSRIWIKLSVKENFFSYVLIHTIWKKINIPVKIVTCQRTVSSRVDALCILLKWLAFPCWYTNMVPTFGEKWNRIVPIYNHMLNYIYTQHHHRLQSWNQYFYSQQSLKSMLMSYMKKLHHLKTVLALLTVL